MGLELVMTETAVEVIWNGTELLRPFLVPIDSLEPYPDNPRQGDVERLRASLRRFGQRKPIVTEDTITVAGNHLVIAATAEGWTHVAAIPNEFDDEEERRAFMIADNATSDHATYNDELLVRHLLALREADALAGSGYTDDELDERLAAVRRLTDTPIPQVAHPRAAAAAGMKDLVLVFSEEHHGHVEAWLRQIAAVKGTQGVSETVYVALGHAADTIT
jgi:ParB-like nuclease domain